MRQLIKDFISLYTPILQGPVIEVGSLQVPGQEGFADLRPMFPGMKYTGIDMRTGTGVDLVADITRGHPKIKGRTVLCLDTLEHIDNLDAAIKNMKAMMEEGGILIISSVMDFPIHDHPSDYWRFTPEGFRYLLKDFEYCFVVICGRESFPHTVIGIASDYYIPILWNPIAAWQRRYRSNGNCLTRFIRKLIRHGRRLVR